MSNRLIIIILLSTFLLSCEKVVNIDLNEAAPQYVVEGEVFEGTDTVRVLVSLTTDY